MGFKIISPYLLNKFPIYHCRPLVGRDLRVRRSIPVLFSFSRSYNGHRRVPPFHLFSVSLVSRLRVPSIIEALFIASPRVFPRFGVLGYSFLGFRLIMGRNHRFSYPPFLYSSAASRRSFRRPLTTTTISSSDFPQIFICESF